MSEHATYRFSIHCQPVIIESHLPQLGEPIDRALGEFAIASVVGRMEATKAVAVRGTIKRYEQREVLRHLSGEAVQIASRDEMEIYQDGERFWMIDDRWGIAEINLLKGQWRAWVIDEPPVDTNDVVEMIVMHPIAQLLCGRGLCLLPAASLTRGETGLLIIAPFGIEPELTAMLKAGYRLLGQRWSALRETKDGIEMLHMPGDVERNMNGRRAMVGGRVDLENEFCGSATERASCTDVVLVEPGRRTTAGIKSIARLNALSILRSDWPIAQLHTRAVSSDGLLAKMSRRCAVSAARFSREPAEFLELLRERSAEIHRFQRVRPASQLSAA